MAALKVIAKRILGPSVGRVIRSGVNTLRDYPQYLTGGGHAGRLRHLDIEITFACNARCRMCPLYGEHRDSARKKPQLKRRDELSTSEIQSVLEQCGRMGTQHVTFTGGEPFLRRDLSDLIGFAKQEGMTVGVISNGSILSNEIAYNATAAGLDWLHISLDGPEEVHNTIRRVPNMFARIEANLALLRANQERQNRSRPLVSVGCTVSAMNQSCLHELVAIAARWKASLAYQPLFFVFDSQNQPSTGTCTSIKPEDWRIPDYMRNIDVDLLAREFTWVRQLSREYRVAVDVAMKTGAKQLRERYFGRSYSANNKCLYPWYAARMNPYGDVYNCSLQTLMGNVTDQPLESIWNSPQYVAFRRAIRQRGRFDSCARCCALNPFDVLCRVLPRFAWTAS